MKAVIFDKRSKPKLVLKEVQKPTPKPGEILVRVHYASLNAADYRSIKIGMVPKSKIYGSGVSGTVEAVGENVDSFAHGDEVLADLSDIGFGGLAEYVVARDKIFVKKPDTLSFEDAAALPVAATTALKAVRAISKPEKGKEVLIVGSAGGVGTFALQLAKYFEATVTAVCSTRNIEQSRELEADHCIDYTKEDFTQSEHRYDLILAINGNYPLLKYRKLLNKNGTYVMVGGSFTQIFKSILFGWILSFGGKKMKTLSAKADVEALKLVASLASQGNIRCLIERSYPLSQTAEAMAYLNEGHARGKIVICVKGNE